MGYKMTAEHREKISSSNKKAKKFSKHVIEVYSQQEFGSVHLAHVFYSITVRQILASMADNVDIVINDDVTIKFEYVK